MVPESKVSFQWEAQAAHGDEMPRGLAYPDQVCYLSFRMLYQQMRMGIVDRDKALREKREILREYEVYRFNEEMGKHWAQVVKNTDLARAAYRKQRTVENADKLLIAIDGGDYGKRGSENAS